MKCKKGISLEEALQLYKKKTANYKDLPYKSCWWLDGLESDGYEAYYVGFRKSMRDLLNTIYSDEYLKITYIQFYETNPSEIKGFRVEVAVIKYIESEVER